MKNNKILVAEDEEFLGDLVVESLENKGYDVVWVKNGEDAVSKAISTPFDLIVLDVMMPKKDGFTVAKELRNGNIKTPIIFLTSKSQANDVVEGFTVGGNDYLKKPFKVAELVIRMKNLLNQMDSYSAKPTSEYVLGDYTFNSIKQNLQFQGDKPISLTHRESELLHHLILSKNEILNRSIILKKLWGNDDFFSARSMDVFITKLRKKLNKDSSIKIINARGIGYKLMDGLG